MALIRIPFAAYAVPALCCVIAPQAATAQQSGQGREVVQPLPSPASQELRAALTRLARNPRNLDALIAAGTASLKLGDVDAAIGFFGRADELAPGDARVKAGKAAAYVRTRRPVEALKLFQEAEAGGVEIVRLAGDYGLAYDLVGRNREAQAAYRRALAGEDNAEVTRRLALSLAIDGDSQGFEQTLRPLLAQRDFAAYRTRAFGLAILGRADDAVAIAEAVMPRTLSRKMEPYLRYMPRLTKAQQAAAAILGIYPNAAQIGRDDPRIAAVGETNAAIRTPRTADAGLAPSGAPLGEKDADPATTASLTELPKGEAVATVEDARKLARSVQRVSASDPLARTRDRPRIVRASPQVDAPGPSLPVEEPVAAKPEPAVAELSDQAPPVTEPAAARRAPELVAGDAVPAAPGFDLAEVSGSTSAQSEASSGNAEPQPTSVVRPPARLPDTKPATLADAFADFAAPVAAATSPAAGAVDVTAIEAPREVEPEPEGPPPPPAHPSRFWVQIATGRDRSALRFDWRRLSRAADGLLDGKGPFVTPWGQTNRLLAGPYDSRRQARSSLNSLKEKGVDAFTFTSPEGQEIERLR